MSSGFITEKEIAEARKKRQQEWEKVRTPDQPEECPEQPYDSRSLYDRLQEQKAKKNLEYEEAHKMKNLIRGLNNDEVQFLKLIGQNKSNLMKKQILEEEQELKEFRSRVASLHEETVDKKLSTELKRKDKTVQMIAATAKPSQKSLLGNAIKRKNSQISCNPEITETHEQQNSTPIKQTKLETADNEKKNGFPYNINTNKYDIGALKCVAILPGLGHYTESSDSDMSSDSDEDPSTNVDNIKYDLVGRPYQKRKRRII